MASLHRALQNPGTSSATLAVASTLSAAILLGAMGFLGRNHMPVDGKTVLLTGATEGLGRSAARQLSEKGANIIVVARNVARLEETVAEIKAAAKSPQTQRFHLIAADVSQPNYASHVVEEASRWNGGLPPDIVWCVAGISTPMLWADSPDAVAAARRNMDVNYWGAAEMAHAILRVWYEPSIGPGPAAQPKHLIFTASVLVFFGVAGYGPYTPSKNALRGLADTLCQEALLYPDHPVKIHVVTPGTILSPGFDREQRTKPGITLQLEKDDPRQTPDQVASAAITGLERGNYFVTVAFLGEAMRYANMGGSLRNNWLVDTVGAWLLAVVWFFVLWVLHGDIRAYAKKHGRPNKGIKKT